MSRPPDATLNARLQQARGPSRRGILPGVLTRSPFANYPARFYLEKYYAAVGEENQAFLRAVAAGVAPIDRLGSVIELGGGPSLCGMIAMTAATSAGPERVVWLDVGAPNLAEIEAWLGDTSAAFDYTPILSWAEAEFGVDRREIAARLRSATWDLRLCDLSVGLPDDLRGAGDVVASYFVAECCTATEDAFVELTRRVADAAGCGARLVLAYIRNSGPYTLNDDTIYSAVAVDEDNLPRLLNAAGIGTAGLEVRRGPRDEPPPRGGYSGMTFVHGPVTVLVKTVGP